MTPADAYSNLLFGIRIGMPLLLVLFCLSVAIGLILIAREG